MDRNKSAIQRGFATANRQAPTLRVTEFVRGVITELRRVTWPTREEWITATILTVALVVGIGLYTFLVDRIFGYIFQWIHPQ
jgi:preprotein translocase subunit SecE